MLFVNFNFVFFFVELILLNFDVHQSLGHLGWDRKAFQYFSRRCNIISAYGVNKNKTNALTLPSPTP